MFYIEFFRRHSTGLKGCAQGGLGFLEKTNGNKFVVDKRGINFREARDQILYHCQHKEKTVRLKENYEFGE